MPIEEDYATVDEAAHYWRVSPWTVRSWLRTGKDGLVKYKIAGKVLVSRSQMTSAVKPVGPNARKSEAVA